MGEIMRRKHYTNIKAYVTRNFAKKVRYNGLPLSLERHENLIKDLKYLREYRFVTLQPHQSLVLFENFGCKEPVASLDISANTFWDHVFSGDWHGADSMRVGEGQLLDILLEGLFIATNRRILKTYKAARFDQIPRLLKSSLKHSNIEEDILLLPVKILFTHYSENETGEVYEPPVSLRLIHGRPYAAEHDMQKENHRSQSSLSSNMSTKFMTVWEDEDIDELQEDTEASIGKTSLNNTRSNSSKYSTPSSNKEPQLDSERSESTFSQPSVRTCSSIAEMFTHTSSRSSQSNSDKDGSSSSTPSNASRLRSGSVSSSVPSTGNRINKYNTTSTGRAPITHCTRTIQKMNRKMDMYSSSESDDTSQSMRTPTPESMVNNVHFESKVIRRKPADNRTGVNSAKSHLLLDDKNFQEQKAVDQAVAGILPAIDRRPLLTDKSEHVVFSDDEYDVSDMGTTECHKECGIITQVNELGCGLKLAKTYRYKNADQLMKTKLINRKQRENQLVKDTKPPGYNEKALSNLLFVKYGDSLTKTQDYTRTNANLQTKNNPSKLNPLQPLVRYDRHAVRNSEYFKRAANCKIPGISIKCDEVPKSQGKAIMEKIHTSVQEKSTAHEEQPIFETGRLKLTHSITRMVRIERNKEILKSIKPMSMSTQRVAERLEEFIKNTHLPRQRQRMWRNRQINAVAMNRSTQADTCYKDAWILEAYDYFKKKTPDDFYEKLLEASAKFRICKEQVTLSNTWKTVTTVTFNKKDAQ